MLAKAQVSHSIEYSSGTGNRTLEEKLKAARENLRFHDKRIADLEAQLAPPE